MKGLIQIYLNFHPEHKQDIQQTLDLVLKANSRTLEKILTESEYQVVFVPTTKEACRVEKIDFDKPFPRFLTKTHYDVAEVEKKGLDLVKLPDDPVDPADKDDAGK